jgi:hypothetical protein
MSGVTGAERVRSRADFAQFVDEFREVIGDFSGFVDMITSGSYNSDLTKNTFGDIDLIVHIHTSLTKQVLKQNLVKYLQEFPEDVIVPFTSEKHLGKRTSNTGELVSVRFHSKTLGYSVQIDTIVALTEEEMEFKRQFLDMPAEKQGLVLGLVKVAAIENTPFHCAQLLALKDSLYFYTPVNSEYEFSLSSSKLELRLVHYKPGTYEEILHDVTWTSQNWNDVIALLDNYDLDKSFDQLLLDVKNTIVNPRSAKRIMGLFKSMVTVKSGEVGTPKGANKEKALSKVILCLV